MGKKFLFFIFTTKMLEKLGRVDSGKQRVCPWSRRVWTKQYPTVGVRRDVDGGGTGLEIKIGVTQM